MGIDAIARALGTLGGFDLGQGLDRPASALGLRFEREAFFIAGSESAFIRSGHLPEISKLFPNYALASIRGAGHWVHSEDPAETIRMVREFLDRPERELDAAHRSA